MTAPMPCPHAQCGRPLRYVAIERTDATARRGGQLLAAAWCGGEHDGRLGVLECDAGHRIGPATPPDLSAWNEPPGGA